LGQSDISVLRKADINLKMSVIRKKFDKQKKEMENAANKEVWKPKLVVVVTLSFYRLLNEW